MKNRALVLNLIPNTIGDNILLTPFVEILSKSKNITVDITVSPSNKELFINNPFLNKIIVIDELKYIAGAHHRLMKLCVYLKMVLRYGWKFRKKYDVCYIMLPNFSLNVLIPALARIKFRIGFTYPGAIFSFLLTKKSKYRGIETKDYDRHFIESYLDLLRIDDIPFNEKDVVCRLYLSNKEEFEYGKLLKKNKLTRYICFHIGSKANSWPITKFKELAKTLLKTTNYKLVLVGSKSEFHQNEALSVLGSRILNLSGRLNLRQLMFLLKNSKFSVCNDSGIAHMSSALGVQTIVLFGPHSPKHSRPMGPGKIYIIYKYWKSFPYVKRGSEEGNQRIDSIEVKDVLDAINDLTTKAIYE